ncbi:MAG: TonB-dependent receptor domain-containing protein [Phycisphaeraceae bacterium JB051]
MKYSLPLTVLLAGSTFLGSTALHAQDNAASAEGSEQTQLADTVVKAQPSKQNRMVIVDSEQITNTQASTLEEMFSNELGIAVGGGNVVAQKFYVRGIEDTQMNVQIDGAVQAGELYHHQGRVQVEPEFIKAIENEAGAGAATAGAGALNGSIRITLKDAFDMLKEGQAVGGLIKGSYFINGDNGYKGVASVYGRLADNIGILGSFTYHDYADYEPGDGNINGGYDDPNAFEHEHGYIKVNGEFGDHETSLTYERLYDNGYYYERPNMTAFRGTYRLTDHELERNTISYNHRYNPVSELVDVKGTLYYTNSRYIADYIDGTGVYGEGEFSSIGFDLRNTSIFGDHSVTYGVDFRFDDAYGRSNATSLPGSSDEEAIVFGLYAQDNWQFAEQWKLSFGARVDYYSWKGVDGLSDGFKTDDWGFSPNVGLTWDATDDLALTVRYSRAFRGVLSKEAFFMGLYQNQGNVEPELASNLEFVVDYSHDWFFATASIYSQKIENYIAHLFNGPSGPWGTMYNAGDADSVGYELEVGGEWENLRVSLGMWYADTSLDGTDLTDGNMGLGTQIGRTWIGKLDYLLPQQNVLLGLVGRYVESEENTIATTAPDKPSYFVMDFNANWRPKGDDSLLLSFSINNLFDEFYYDHASYGYNGNAGAYIGYPSKGREFVVSATVKF